jgi:hypothetical protein
MPRTTIPLGDIDLNRASLYVAVPCTGAKAITISAKKISGAWATRTLEVKKRVGIGAAESFTSARTFAAGGGPALAFTESDLAGLAELEVQGGGTAEVGQVRLEAAIEYDANTAMPGQFGGAIWGGGDGAETRPGMPPEA